MFTGVAVIKSQKKISDFPICVNWGRIQFRIWIGIKTETRICIKMIGTHPKNWFREAANITVGFANK
jgi:hypothetical protein